MAEYANHIHAPPPKDDILAYAEQPSFLDELGSAEPLPEIESWRRSVAGPVDNSLIDGTVRVDQPKRLHNPREPYSKKQ
jgi:hypothetical protein